LGAAYNQKLADCKYGFCKNKRNYRSFCRVIGGVAWPRTKSHWRKGLALLSSAQRNKQTPAAYLQVLRGEMDIK
jgi:hypothetical protein